MHDLLYLTALSVMGASAPQELAGKIKIEGAEALYESLPVPSRRVMPYIATIYGNDPISAAEKILTRCNEGGYSVIAAGNHAYPELLREIHGAPLVLYAKGNLPRMNSVSIVGTRASDRDSESVARRIANECVNASLCVVSGIASGIDRFAHLGALDARGSTVAVLPYGIDMRAPLMNRDIFFLIESSPNCAVISEHPPGIRAEKWMFVKRNRIISGLSRATVVVKAGEGSGALVTAKYALDQGREVFACGGLPFDSGYAGCQNLIRDGGWIVSDTVEIIRATGGAGCEKTLFDGIKPFAVQIHKFPEGSTEEKMIRTLKNGEEDIDTLIRDCKISPAEAQRAAICLEIA